MKYEIGDKVRFLCDKIPGTDKKLSSKTHGVVMRTAGIGEYTYRIRVGSNSWYFREEDIEPYDYVAPMTAPDMELDEIHKSQKLMEKLK